MPRSFNGTTDKITVLTAFTMSCAAACSVAAWIKCPSSATNNTIYGEGKNGNGNTYFILLANSGNIQITWRINSGQTRLNVVGSGGGCDDTWHHVAFAQDASGHYSLYIDGVQDPTAHGTFSPGATLLDLATIGVLDRSGGISAFFPGSIAHVATWARQLSAKEVISLVNGLSPLFLNPNHYWPLWGIDSSEPDLGSVAHVIGTLTGTTKSNSGPRISPDLLWLP